MTRDDLISRMAAILLAQGRDPKEITDIIRSIIDLKMMQTDEARASFWKHFKEHT